MARKSLILQLALATIIAMPLVALLADHFSETIDLRTALIGTAPLWKQILLGTIAGMAIALGAQYIISSRLLNDVNAHYANVLGRFRLSASEIVFISLCAGVGEEILFRGAIQPYVGVILTSLIFVGIHGYINPYNWRLSIYGFYMTAAMFLIGYMANALGLISCITAHTVIDIYLLYHLQRTAGSTIITENPNLEDEYEENENEEL